MKTVQKMIDAAIAGKKKAKIGHYGMTQDDESINFTFYFTTICKVDKKTGTATYDNGGFETVSTVRAMNAYKELLAKSGLLKEK